MCFLHNSGALWLSIYRMSIGHSNAIYEWLPMYNINTMADVYAYVYTNYYIHNNILQLTCHLQIAKTFGRSLKILSLLCWSMSPASATLNGSLWISTYKSDMQMWLDMFYWVSGCGTLNLHLLWSCSTHFLVWGVYYSLLAICLLVL